jgi:crotonobetainyl-CoA:carnitine CoA-transferase CaiB-like acyl-CoA transferase
MENAMQNNAPLPLAGMRVIELTHAWAGPLAGMMLADMGAEVIKVESPDQDAESRGGSPYHNGESVIFMMTHRNKKSATLNLKDPRGFAIFIDLIKTADVLLNNMRPGTLNRLGLGYEQLHEIHPRLIYTSVSGFGNIGPDAGRAGVDQIAVAVTGLAATTMSAPTSMPATLGVPVCDITAAMWACHGTLCAYIARQKTGLGQRVDASLLEAGLSLMINPTAQHYHKAGYTGRKTAYNGASEFLLCADGKYVSVFASYPALWERFVKAVRVDRLTDDPRFKTRDSRTAHAKELCEVLAEIFSTRPSANWVSVLREAGVPVSIVYTIGEALQDPQVQATQMLQEQQHPVAGKLHLLGPAVKLSATPGTIRTPAPALGENTAEVLAYANVSKQELTALKSASVI